MSRGRIKEILHTARIDKSPGNRICRANRQNHNIPKGAYFLAVKDGLGEKCYCLKCARIILEHGREKLDALMCQLDSIEQSD